jgi:hypothetical protein
MPAATVWRVQALRARAAPARSALQALAAALRARREISSLQAGRRRARRARWARSARLGHLHPRRARRAATAIRRAACRHPSAAHARQDRRAVLARQAQFSALLALSLSLKASHPVPNALLASISHLKALPTVSLARAAISALRAHLPPNLVGLGRMPIRQWCNSQAFSARSTSASPALLARAARLALRSQNPVCPVRLVTLLLLSHASSAPRGSLPPPVAARHARRAILATSALRAPRLLSPAVAVPTQIRRCSTSRAFLVLWMNASCALQAQAAQWVQASPSRACLARMLPALRPSLARRARLARFNHLRVKPRA